MKRPGWISTEGYILSEALSNRASGLVEDRGAIPIGPVRGTGWTKRDAQVTWTTKRTGRLSMNVAPDPPLPKLIVKADGRLARLYSRDSGRPIGNPMPRERALRIARIFS